MPAGRDRARPITLDLIDQAKEYLIVERVTHLDQLADKLREPRVRRVIEPMLAGTQLDGVPEDDRQNTWSTWGSCAVAVPAVWSSPIPSTTRSCRARSPAFLRTRCRGSRRPG